MKRLLTIFAFLIVAAANAQMTVIDSIYSGGQYRTYRLYVPSSYTGATARPLIFNLHGYTSNASDQQLYSNFGPIADTANFLMVFPQGTLYMGQPFWNAGINSSLVDDVQFLSDLIDSLDLSYNIDLDRVFSCGMSNGGYMSNTLACELSNRIAAVASVTGSMFTSQHAVCSAGRPVPVMLIHGTADATVPYNGSSSSLAIETLAQYWSSNNGGSTTPVVTPVPNTSTTDASTADRMVYGGGLSGSSVELYRVNGGGHTWPGAFPLPGYVTNQDFKASEKIWLFFRQYQKSSLTSLADAAQPQVNIYPNPAHDELFIDAKGLTHVKIFDATGRLCIRSAESRIEVGALAAGLYFVQATANGVVHTTKFLRR